MNFTLEKIATELNKANILWGLGGSKLLDCYHLIESVNDIDILIVESDIKQAENIFSIIATEQKAISKEPFATKHFRTYTHARTSIDVMAGFQIHHPKGLYTMEFDRLSLTDSTYINDTYIPLSSLEDWYILYTLIPRKQYKADLIEAHWKKYGIQHPYLITRSLKKSLPSPLRTRLQTILLQHS